MGGFRFLLLLRAVVQPAAGLPPRLGFGGPPFVGGVFWWVDFVVSFGH
jgi:hypothetical protein